VSATLIYAVESDLEGGDFGSIPVAMWWALTTITTVGYGDMVPQTVLGKLMGCWTMVGGTLIVSISVAIVTSSFEEQYRHRSEAAKLVRAMKTQRFNAATHASDCAEVDVGHDKLLHSLHDMERSTAAFMDDLDVEIRTVVMAECDLDRNFTDEMLRRTPPGAMLESLRSQKAAFVQAAKSLVELRSLNADMAKLLSHDQLRNRNRPEIISRRASVL